jgi:hypothetical protein
MATQVQLRRGTAAQNNAFTGAVGEVTYDSDNDTLRVHDGGAAGGYELAKSNLQTHTNIDINSGTIDGTVIGGSTPAAISGTTGQFDTSLNVDGTVTADGLTVDGATVLNNSNASVDFTVKGDNGSALLVDGSTGDISFYEDTGTTPKFFWDASAEALGIGTTSPVQKLSINGSGGTLAGTAAISLWDSNSAGSRRWAIANGASATGVDQINALTFNVGSGSSSADPLTSGVEVMRIKSDGSVGIGTSSPAHLVDAISTSGSASARFGSTYAVGANNGTLIISNGGTGNGMLRFDYETSTDRARIGVTTSSQDLQFFTAGNNERMRIDSSGNVGIGTSSPSAKLDVDGSVVIRNSSAINELTFSGAEYTNIYSQTTSGFDIGTTSSSGNSYLRFLTENVERMRIDSPGNLLVGTTTVPSLGGNTAGKFAVVNGTAQIGVQDNGDGGIFASYSASKSIGLSAGASYGSNEGYSFIKLTPTTGSSASVQVVANSNGVQLTHDATAWSSASDVRLKTVVSGFTDALADVAKLEAIKFTWKNDNFGKVCVGLTAQSVQSVLPEAVDEFVKTEEDGSPTYLSVRYTDVIPLLTAAIQEQQAIIEALEARVAALEA